MDRNGKSPSPFRFKKGGLYILILLIVGLLGTVVLSALTREAEAGGQVSLKEGQPLPELLIIQGNTLQSPRTPLTLNNGALATSRLEVVVTGYSSSPGQTDDTPYLTAAGTSVRGGIVAINILPFGTKIRFPEFYEDEVFVVEDRMSPDRDYHIDIWFSSYQEARNFGIKKTYIEILGS